MNVLGISYFILSFLCILPGALLYVRQPRIRARVLFLAVSISMGYTLFSLGCFQQALNIEDARFWWKLSSHWPFNYAMSFHFIALYTNQKRFISGFKLFFLYITSAIIALIDFFTFYLSEVKMGDGLNWLVHYPVNILSVLCQAVWSSVLMFLIIFIIFLAIMNSRKGPTLNRFVLILGSMVLSGVVVTMETYFLFSSTGLYMTSPLLASLCLLSILLGNVFFEQSPNLGSSKYGVCPICGAKEVNIDTQSGICIRCLLNNLGVLEDKVSHLMKVMDITKL